jgi:hypothetical protein
MSSFRTSIALVLMLGGLAGCGGGGDSSPGPAPNPPPPPPAATFTAASGVAQKGPLILGSAVTAQEVTAALSPNGKQYSYQTNSDLGTFSPTSAFTSQYIGLSATGYYFDEVTNAVSAGPVTLNGYSDLAANSVLNVNLLTTLAYQRIRTLVTSGMAFSTAQTQAEREVLAALEIRSPGTLGSFSSLDLSKGTDGDKILATISSLFVYGNTSGNLSALVQNFQSDIADDGTINTTATRATLQASARALNPADIAANLSAKYGAAGVTFSAGDIAEWLDQDGDGLVGKFEYQVADASQSTSFLIPAAVITAHAGKSVSASDGRLTVNGAAIGAATQIASGDIVTIAPPAAEFPNGVQVAYLMSGDTKIARVSFVSGLVSIDVTPASYSLPAGLTRQFVATGTYTDGSSSDITGTVSWSSSTPGIANMAVSGLATGNVLGTTTISAASGSIAGTTTLNVVAPVLLSIAVSPNPATVVMGRTRNASAIGTFSNGSTADISSAASWEVSNPAVATVTGGVVAGVALGDTVVTATRDSVSGSSPVTVAIDAWSPAASMSAARRLHTATLLSDGRVLVAGGAGPQLLATAEIYDPVTDSWSPTPDMATPRFAHTATLLPGGKVLVIGGSYAAPAGTTAEIYDPVGNSWSPAGNMSAARAHHSATLLGNGKVLVAGFSPTGPATAEIYDPVANDWAPVGSLAHPRDDHRAELLPDGRVMIFGGNSIGQNSALATPEIFDPVAETWTDGAPMMAGRWSHTTTTLPNGKILVTGGSAPPLFIYDTAELYDTAANTWEQLADMSLARSSHTATLLPTGSVLIVGGRYDFQPSFTSAEIYNPAANAWLPAAPIFRGRSEHSATLLNNGTVLVIGGINNLALPDAGVSATAELFDYADNPL